MASTQTFRSPALPTCARGRRSRQTALYCTLHACKRATAAIHEVCRFDNRYCMVKLLLQGKGDPTIFNSHGESPIEFAQRRGVSALLRLLQRHAR